jgi:hypothetical protein
VLQITNLWTFTNYCFVTNEVGVIVTNYVAVSNYVTVTNVVICGGLTSVVRSVNDLTSGVVEVEFTNGSPGYARDEATMQGERDYTIEQIEVTEERVEGVSLKGRETALGEHDGKWTDYLMLTFPSLGKEYTWGFTVSSHSLLDSLLALTEESSIEDMPADYEVALDWSDNDWVARLRMMELGFLIWGFSWCAIKMLRKVFA